MDTRSAYDNWSSQYDTNINRTRDLEAIALRETLSIIQFSNCLEIGCGTGKNTAWLIDQAAHVTAVDFSGEMLAKAKEKITSSKVNFKQADILQPWNFADRRYDLVSFSLVLEHIEDLDPIFKKTANAITPGGYVYIGELHPFKQYSGSKARFETEAGEQVVSCFDHHLSDFTRAGKDNGFDVIDINEYFDDGDRKNIPRIITILLKKS
jgi:ubiquinone/menaquinone biosynthesis C-methylase UbiE